MALKLNKVNRGPHLSTLVASSISREISEGRLQPGEQLPTELQLSQTFGVSRNVVREAIARLRSEGLVWSQQGRGAFVVDAPESSDLRINLDAAQEPGAFRSLFELREILEIQGAALAALRRSDAALEAIAAALTAMETVPYGSVAWLRADLAFHESVARATDNDYIHTILTIVADKVRESILLSGDQHHSTDLAARTLAEHRAIYDAIKAHDGTAAKRAMRHHVQQAAIRLGLGTVTPARTDK